MNYPGLDRWVLGDKIGDGAFSSVFRARDKTGELGEADEVAIKIIRKHEMTKNQVRTPFSTQYFPRSCFSLTVRAVVRPSSLQRSGAERILSN